MKLNLELNTLKSVMRDFYAVTKVRSSIYDGNYQKILSYPDEHTPICSIMHGRADTLAHCKYSNLRAFKQCEKEKGTIVYTCHLGLSEVVAPLWDNNIIIGYIMFGQLTCSPPPGNLLENIREKCNQYNLQIDNLEEIISQISYRNNEELHSLARLMEACTYYIMHHEIVRLNRNGFILKLDEYIEKHLTEKITVPELCEEFLTSRTKLYETFSDTLNMSLGRYIKLKRIERAKFLLAETNDPLSVIVAETGLGEYNYFCSVFKKETGITANQYRINSRSETL